jgi:uncharacterized membrane protein
MVVLLAVVLMEDICLGDRLKELPVKNLIAKPGVKLFTFGVLPGRT